MNIDWRRRMYEYKLERVGLRFNFRVNVRGMVVLVVEKLARVLRWNLVFLRCMNSLS